MPGGLEHFVGVEADSVEDIGHAHLPARHGHQAGLDTAFLDVARVGWDADRRRFVDPAHRPITAAFKLYPWEWMMDEAFGPHLPVGPDPVVGAAVEGDPQQQGHPRRPLGAVPRPPEPGPGQPERTTWAATPSASPARAARGTTSASPAAAASGTRPAATTPAPTSGSGTSRSRAFDGFTPTVGSWMINGTAAGVGVREDASPVTGNTSRFVPHVFGD